VFINRLTLFFARESISVYLELVDAKIFVRLHIFAPIQPAIEGAFGDPLI
jgi:hypothetical protein